MGDRNDHFNFKQLAECSRPTLESIELARLNRAADLRKEIHEVIDECIEAEAEARMARWLIENRTDRHARAVEMAATFRDCPKPPKVALERADPSHAQFLRGRRLKTAV
jgi:hypothetical protein